MTMIDKKRNIMPAVLLLIFLIMLLSAPLLTFATSHLIEAYVPLVGIPGVTDTGDFKGFLEGAFKIGLAIAATLAVVMITIGGFQYMTTDSVYNKTEGKDKIQNAIVGLLIALLIWLILFTINPKLLNFDIDIPEANQTNQAPPPVPSTCEAGGCI